MILPLELPPMPPPNPKPPPEPEPRPNPELPPNPPPRPPAQEPEPRPNPELPPNPPLSPPELAAPPTTAAGKRRGQGYSNSTGTGNLTPNLGKQMATAGSRQYLQMLTALWHSPDILWGRERAVNLSKPGATLCSTSRWQAPSPLLSSRIEA